MPFINVTTHSLIDSQHLIGQYKAKYYLVYSNSDHQHWYTKFLQSGYYHVSIIKFTGLFWIKLDFGLGWTDFNVLPYDQYDTIKDVIDEGESYQYVERWLKPRLRVRSIVTLWTCVEAAKAVLGIRAWWILTPFQLYNYLRSNHG